MSELDTQSEVEVVVEQEAPEVKSMDDTIRETYEAIQNRGEETEEEAEARERDDKGRFKASQKSTTPVTAPVTTPVEVSEVVAEEAPVEVAPVEPTPVVVPPEVQRLGLKKEEAEAYAQAPEVLKQAFIRRSEEMHKGLEQFRSKAQFGHQMEQVIAPFTQQIQAMGATPDLVVSRLLAAESQLRNGSPDQKQAMFFKLAQDYGVQLNGEMPTVDPNVSVLQQQIQQLTGWIQQKQQREEQAQADTLNSEIQRFASNPANKHFEAVRNDMAALLQGGIVTNLQEAYERAVYANPNTRTQLLAEQQAQSEVKRKTELAQKAQEAKKAASVNVPKKGSSTPKRPVGTMDETIRAEAERLGII